MELKKYRVERVTYQSGSIEMNALLYAPLEAHGALPAVVHHPSHRSPAAQYEWYMGKLASAGYVALAIEQRGYGSGTPADSDRGGPLQQGDISNGISFLASLPYVDGSRIGVSGHSNGAALALIVSARDARVRACVSMAPKTDWVRALRMAREWKPEFYAQTVKEMNGGVPPEQDPQPYLERSPISYAKDIRVPVLFVVGAQDWVNPSYHCVWMKQALEEHGNRQSEICLIDEVEHFFCRRHFHGYQFDQVTTPTIAWFDRHLQRGVNPQSKQR